MIVSKLRFAEVFQKTLITLAALFVILSKIRQSSTNIKYNIFGLSLLNLNTNSKIF